MPAQDEDEIFDPWAAVEDLDGQELYRILGVKPQASAGEIRAAYRHGARHHHPDKGGDAAAFARLKAAYDVVGHPRRRATYDRWAKELSHRYIPGVTAQPAGGQDVIFAELERLFPNGIDPDSQLVVVCEVCRCPSNIECAICGADICKYCTRKQHWKGEFGLHFPLVQSDRTKREMGRQELEKKRVEDARRRMLADKNYRSEKEVQGIRAFQRTTRAVYDDRHHLATYSLDLAKYYSWTQTDELVFVAVFCPTGRVDEETETELNSQLLRVQSKGSPPAVERLLDYAIDNKQPLKTVRSSDNRWVVVVMGKAVKGERWLRLFRGDPDGARSLEPIYNLVESDSDVVMEMDVPHFVEESDVTIAITSETISVRVLGAMCLSRTFWKDPSPMNPRLPVVAEDCIWILDKETSAGGGCKKNKLLITLAKPPVSESERQWKKGKPQDNRAKQRNRVKGVRFFLDDHDEFKLEDILQAVRFHECGSTYVPFTFEERSKIPGLYSARASLTRGAQAVLQRLERLCDRQALGGGGGVEPPAAAAAATMEQPARKAAVAKLAGEFEAMARRMEELIALDFD